ncbi:MAG TPA: hypothetical protein VLE96_07190 [Chlamydiales bacterium]|nr:hypothetical protein [Chlamydiales bacterium]
MNTTQNSRYNPWIAATVGAATAYKVSEKNAFSGVCIGAITGYSISRWPEMMQCVITGNAAALASKQILSDRGPLFHLGIGAVAGVASHFFFRENNCSDSGFDNCNVSLNRKPNDEFDHCDEKK